MQRPNDDEEEDLPHKATVLLSLGIGEDLRSSKFIVKAPEDANSPRFQDL